MANEQQQYIGRELELFSAAENWKNYFSQLVRPHLGSRVLEVGAGLGATTAVLARGHGGSWLCLEPDPQLAERIHGDIESRVLPGCCTSMNGTVSTLPEGPAFDTILYVDVLEHIENDAAELLLAKSKLAPGGKILILSPAYQWLFSPFDTAVGHYRRYNKQSLLAVVPSELVLCDLRYLDSAGMIASAGNRFLTKSSTPSPAQLKLWDGLLVPVSKVLDVFFRNSFGKSIFGVWRRN